MLWTKFLLDCKLFGELKNFYFSSSESSRLNVVTQKFDRLLFPSSSQGTRRSKLNDEREIYCKLCQDATYFFLSSLICVYRCVFTVCHLVFFVSLVITNNTKLQKSSQLGHLTKFSENGKIICRDAKTQKWNKRKFLGQRVEKIMTKCSYSNNFFCFFCFFETFLRVS